MSNSTLTAVPAGWYSDPLGMPLVRWWSGSRWTSEVSEPRPELVVSGSYSTAA